MFLFISLFPTLAFLGLLPASYYLFQADHYRQNSIFGFRSSQAVKNPSNWKKAQQTARASSFILGLLQLVLTFLLKFFSSSSDLFWFSMPQPSLFY